ncbi:MAG: cysteine synthase family protein [Myxococcaceae bacterium]|nr:cysteine synthase family protein [Myxococcaceae bacterium]
MSQPFLAPARAEALRRRVEQLREEHAGSVVSAIGDTALAPLSRLAPKGSAPLCAKLEGQNPAGSSKDRVALYLIADALERGVLTKDTVLVEASSGNTGISLAMIGARLGLRVLITIAENASIERYKLMNAFGAELVFTPGDQGTSGAIQKARELAQRPGHLWLAQHFNEVNSFAHYETTGVELIRQARALGFERIDAFVAPSGTTGTLMGVSARLKEAFPEVRIVAVWPKDRIMGIRKPEGDDRPGIYDAARLDDIIEVRLEQAMDCVRLVARTEGMLLGPSGGAAICGAMQVVERLESARSGCVAVFLPDWGERYLSLPMYQPPKAPTPPAS